MTHWATYDDMMKRKKPGRPRATAGGLRKGKSIGFTPEEWCKVTDFAEAAGVPVDEYVRCRCLKLRIKKAKGE